MTSVTIKSKTMTSLKVLSSLISLLCVLQPAAQYYLHRPISALIKEHLPSCSVVVFAGSSVTSDVELELLVSSLHHLQIPVVIMSCGNDMVLREQLRLQSLRAQCLVYLLWRLRSHQEFQKVLSIVNEPKPTVQLEEYFLLSLLHEGNISSVFYHMSDYPNVLAVKSIESGVQLWNRCLYCDHGRFRNQLAASWIPGKELRLYQALFPDQFKNFYGYQMRIICVPFEPFVDLIKLPNEKLQLLDSIEHRAIKVLQEILNFTHIILEPYDQQWGIPLDNGSWTGIIGELIVGEADFSSAITMTLDRFQEIRYSSPYFRDPYVIITKTPGPPPQWLSIFRPFPESLWLITFASFVATSLVMCLLILRDQHREAGFTPSLVVLQTYGALLEISLHKHPTGTSSARVFLLLWWGCCMVLIAAYKSNLVARMTVPATTSSIDNLQELWESDIQYGLGVQHGSDYILFKNSPILVFQKIGSKLHFMSFSASMEKVLQGMYGFITWESNAKWKIAQNYSDHDGQSRTYLSKDRIAIDSYSWAFRPNAPFADSFDQIVRHLTENGLIHFWFRQLIQSSSKKTARNSIDSDGRKVSLSLHHLQGAFLILTLGHTVAGVVLTIEIVWKRQSNHIRSRKKRTSIEKLNQERS